MATLTVIQTLLGGGTYTIEVLEGNQTIAFNSESIAQGASVNISFIVSGNPSASAETEAILPMLMNSMREINQPEEGSN